MGTSFSGGGSRSTRREPSTLGKQLVSFIACGCESSAPIINVVSIWINILVMSFILIENWARVAQWVRSLDHTTHTSLSPLRRGFAPRIPINHHYLVLFDSITANVCWRHYCIWGLIRPRFCVCPNQGLDFRSFHLNKYIGHEFYSNWKLGQGGTMS
jgi:hypothetical protein